DFCHIARSQTQPASGVSIASDPAPLYSGNAQRLEQRRAGKFVEGASGRLADDGRHERERARVVKELLSRRGTHRKTEDVTTRVPRHMHAGLVVVVVSRSWCRLNPLQTHRHGERVYELDTILLGGT